MDGMGVPSPPTMDQISEITNPHHGRITDDASNNR
jgi:hypothetical protein